MLYGIMCMHENPPSLLRPMIEEDESSSGVISNRQLSVPPSSPTKNQPTIINLTPTQDNQPIVIDLQETPQTPNHHPVDRFVLPPSSASPPRSVRIYSPQKYTQRRPISASTTKRTATQESDQYSVDTYYQTAPPSIHPPPPPPLPPTAPPETSRSPPAIIKISEDDLQKLGKFHGTTAKTRPVVESTVKQSFSLGTLPSPLQNCTFTSSFKPLDSPSKDSARSIDVHQSQRIQMASSLNHKHRAFDDDEQVNSTLTHLLNFIESYDHEGQSVSIETAIDHELRTAMKQLSPKASEKLVNSLTSRNKLITEDDFVNPVFLPRSPRKVKINTDHVNPTVPSHNSTLSPRSDTRKKQSLGAVLERSWQSQDRTILRMRNAFMQKIQSAAALEEGLGSSRKSNDAEFFDGSLAWIDAKTGSIKCARPFRSPTTPEPFSFEQREIEKKNTVYSNNSQTVTAETDDNKLIAVVKKKTTRNHNDTEVYVVDLDKLDQQEEKFLYNTEECDNPPCDLSKNTKLIEKKSCRRIETAIRASAAAVPHGKPPSLAQIAKRVQQRNNALRKNTTISPPPRRSTVISPRLLELSKPRRTHRDTVTSTVPPPASSSRTFKASPVPPTTYRAESVPRLNTAYRARRNTTIRSATPPSTARRQPSSQRAGQQKSTLDQRPSSARVASSTRRSVGHSEPPSSGREPPKSVRVSLRRLPARKRVVLAKPKEDAYALLASSDTWDAEVSSSVAGLEAVSLPPQPNLVKKKSAFIQAKIVCKLCSDSLKEEEVAMNLLNDVVICVSCKDMIVGSSVTTHAVQPQVLLTAKEFANIWSQQQQQGRGEVSDDDEEDGGDCDENVISMVIPDSETRLISSSSSSLSRSSGTAAARLVAVPPRRVLRKEVDLSGYPNPPPYMVRPGSGAMIPSSMGEQEAKDAWDKAVSTVAASSVSVVGNIQSPLSHQYQHNSAWTAYSHRITETKRRGASTMIRLEK